MTQEELANKCIKENVCCSCGGKLTTAKIQDMPFPQVICPECHKIDWGCKPDVYNLAVKLVDGDWFNYYHNENKEYQRFANIDRAVLIIRKIDELKLK